MTSPSLGERMDHARSEFELQNGKQLGRRGMEPAILYINHDLTCQYHHQTNKVDMAVIGGLGVGMGISFSRCDALRKP